MHDSQSDITDIIITETDYMIRLRLEGLRTRVANPTKSVWNCLKCKKKFMKKLKIEYSECSETVSHMWQDLIRILVNWGQVICPLNRGCPLFGESIIRGFNVV